MPFYFYRATDEMGCEITGSIEAKDLDAAEGALLERGWEMFEVLPEATDGSGIKTLNSNDATVVASVVAQLTAAELPLAPGLRAAAREAELGTPAVELLRHIAAQLESGKSMSQILNDEEQLRNSHIARIALGGAQKGRLGHALSELSVHRQTVDALRRSVVQAIAYPMAVGGMAGLLLLSFLLVVATPFEEMFDEFGLILPLATELVLWWRNTGVLIVGTLGVLSVLLVLVLRSRLGRGGWLRLCSTAPLFGVLFQYCAFAEWSSLLSMLLRHQIPLPHALRLAASGVSNEHMGDLSRELADELERGRSMAEAIANNGQFPATLAPITRWGEQSGMMSEAFVATRDMFSRRLRARVSLLRTVFAPLSFIFIGCCALGVVFGLFAPLLSLIQGLS